MNRRGSALVAALLALLLTGAMAAAALAVAQLRWRAGVGVAAAARATSRVDALLERRVAEWNQAWADSLTTGAAIVLGGWSGPRFWLTDSVTRLGHSLYQLHASAEETGADGASLARTGAALLLEIAPVVLRDTAAVISTAPVVIDGAAHLAGGDQVPAGWDSLCPEPLIPALDQLVQADVLARVTPGAVELLRPLASGPLAGTITGPTPTISAGGCEVQPHNWGDPGLGACAAFLPVVLLQAGARVVDGMGSGTLLALGDVELSGSFAFTGVMLAAGKVILSDHATLTGALLAVGEVQLRDQSEISHSSCAVGRALRAHPVVLRRVPGGWWRVP